jgi:hypothetical protein
VTGRLTRLLAVLRAATVLPPGVATAAEGTGRAPRPEDVTCDRLHGLFTGQKITADTSSGLVDEFLAHHPTPVPVVRTFAIRVGEADAGELARVAAATGGHILNADADALPVVFKEIHGCL